MGCYAILSAWFIRLTESNMTRHDVSVAEPVAVAQWYMALRMPRFIYTMQSTAATQEMGRCVSRMLFLLLFSFI